MVGRPAGGAKALLIGPEKRRVLIQMKRQNVRQEACFRSCSDTKVASRGGKNEEGSFFIRQREREPGHVAGMKRGPSIFPATTTETNSVQFEGRETDSLSALGRNTADIHCHWGWGLGWGWGGGCRRRTVVLNSRQTVPGIARGEVGPTDKALNKCTTLRDLPLMTA